MFTATQMKQVLRDSAINPKNKSAYNFVIELNNPEYCMQRAAELLQDCTSIKAGRDNKLKEIISLLAIARIQNGCLNTK